MPRIRVRHEQPANENDFEILCLRLLKKHWNCPSLELYAHRGENQFGIDILDMGGDKPLRAAQCKLHESWKTIPPREILNEVKKAREFVPPLRRYTIMTTAKVSSAAQNAVLRINKQHKKKRLFKLEIKHWNDIENLLDENPEVLNATYGMAPVGRVENSIAIGDESRIIRDLTGHHTDQNSLDAEIDEARDFLLSKDYQLARLLLQRIRRRKWDRLAPRQKFRVLSNIGASFLIEEKAKDAIPCFLEAKTYQPKDERAQANEVLAYILSGKAEKAFTLARKARKHFPFSGTILSYWLKCAPSDLSFDDAQREVPSILESDPEVCAALAQRALDANEFGAAEKFSRLSVDRIPDWPFPKILLAQCIFHSELLKTQCDYIEWPQVCDLSRLREAEAILSKAVDQAQSVGPKSFKAGALLLRAEIRRILGEIDKADDDVVGAWQCLPTNASVVRDHARLLMRSGDRQRGILELRQAIAISEGREDLTILLASTLLSGSEPGEQQEGTQLLVDLAKRVSHLPQGLREDAIWSALEGLSRIRRLEEGRDLLSRIPDASISEAALATFQSKFELLAGHLEEAHRHANEAIRSLATSVSREDIRILGSLLMELGRYSDALPLWNRIASPRQLTLSTRRLMECAERLKRHDVIMEVCGKLRDAGIENEELLSYEGSIRQLYDPETAVELLQQYLARHPDAKRIRLQLSALGLYLARKDLITTKVEMMPRPDEVPSSNWPLIVRVMVEGGNPNDALAYSYDLLRQHFSEPHAHQAYIAALLPLDTKLDIPEFTEAGPGAAVCFIETGTNQEQWRIIEEMYDPDERLSEVSPSHFLALQLKGKKIGQEFSITELGIAKRTARIQQIVSKFVFRFRDCLNQWQVRFPSVPGFEMMRVVRKKEPTGEEEVDLSGVFSALDRREEMAKRVVGIYASRPMSLHILGSAFGVGAFQAIRYLAASNDARVNCCLGSAPERSQALQSMKCTTGIVLDLTAIGTLSILCAPEILANGNFPLIVSKGSLTELDRLTNELTLSAKPHGFLGKHEGRYFKAEETEEERTNRIVHLRDLVNTIKKSCQILACPALAAVEPKKRDILIEGFGQSGAESIVLSSEPGRVLWTDDFVMFRIAQREFEIRRVWTQVFLQALMEAKAISADIFYEASANLAGFGYYFTSISLPILKAARSLAQGEFDKWPLQQTIQCLEDEAISAQDILSISAQWIVEVYLEGLRERQDQAVIQILEHLGKRHDGIRIVEALRRTLPSVMGVNVLGARAVDAIVSSWLKHHLTQVNPA